MPPSAAGSDLLFAGASTSARPIAPPPHSISSVTSTRRTSLCVHPSPAYQTLASLRPCLYARSPLPPPPSASRLNISRPATLAPPARDPSDSRAIHHTYPSFVLKGDRRRGLITRKLAAAVRPTGSRLVALQPSARRGRHLAHARTSVEGSTIPGPCLPGKARGRRRSPGPLPTGGSNRLRLS